MTSSPCEEVLFCDGGWGRIKKSYIMMPYSNRITVTRKQFMCPKGLIRLPSAWPVNLSYNLDFRTVCLHVHLCAKAWRMQHGSAVGETSANSVVSTSPVHCTPSEALWYVHSQQNRSSAYEEPLHCAGTTALGRTSHVPPTPSAGKTYLPGNCNAAHTNTWSLKILQTPLSKVPNWDMKARHSPQCLCPR